MKNTIFEYTTVETNSLDEFNSKLNEYGERGWEIVTTETPSPDISEVEGTQKKYKGILKRSKTQQLNS